MYSLTCAQCECYYASICDWQSKKKAKVWYYSTVMLSPLSCYFRNFLYVYVHSLDMKSQSKGQNLGVKLQFMAGEDAKVDALQMIYGRSSGPRFVREYWCPVVYHNK